MLPQENLLGLRKKQKGGKPPVAIKKVCAAFSYFIFKALLLFFSNVFLLCDFIFTFVKLQSLQTVTRLYYVSIRV